MKDLLKSAVWTLAGLAVFSGIAAERARFAAKRDLERSIPGSQFQVSARPRGPIGYITGDLSSARITGSGFAINDLPFAIEPARGILARLSRLELSLQNVTVRALPLKSLDAVIPRVRVDALRALFNGHFTIRSAGEGTGEAVISEDGLRAFIAQKRPQFSDLRVAFLPGETLITGRATILLAPAPIEARVKFAIAEGRFLNAAAADVLVNGRPVPAEIVERLLASLNPILDIKRDLGLDGWLYATSAGVEQGILRVRARVWIPLKRSSARENP